MSGCVLHRAPVPSLVVAAPGPSESTASVLSGQATSKAAAYAAAAGHANESNAPGPAREATAAELSIVSANLPAPSPVDAAAALERVNAALRGDIETARKGWTEAQTEAQKLSADLTAARSAAQAEREANARQWQAKQTEWQTALESSRREADARVVAERAKAEADMRRLIGYIFFGGCALSVAVGVACLTVLSGLAFVGAKLVAGCFILSGILAAVGVGLIQALQHTWIIYAEGAAAVVAVVVVVFAYANHWHANTKTV